MLWVRNRGSTGEWQYFLPPQLLIIFNEYLLTLTSKSPCLSNHRLGASTEAFGSGDTLILSQRGWADGGSMGDFTPLLEGKGRFR